MTDVLATLEAYYDTAPRASATATEVGPFTLFVRDDPAGWHFYARPRLGLDRAVAVADVDLVIGGGELAVIGTRHLPALRGPARIHRMELPHGRFERRIPLPPGAWGALATGVGFAAVRLTRGRR